MKTTITKQKVKLLMSDNFLAWCEFLVYVIIGVLIFPFLQSLTGCASAAPYLRQDELLMEIVHQVPPEKRMIYLPRPEKPVVVFEKSPEEAIRERIKKRHPFPEAGERIDTTDKN